MTLEETLNGGYGGLYGEVVTCDIYRLKSLDFTPDVVFDVGANVGIFSRYAASLFPKALIYAVEPDFHNCAHFREFTDMNRIVLVRRALGTGRVFHGLTAVNGAHETYLSAGLGYPLEELVERSKGLDMCESDILTITLDQLVEGRWQPGMKSILKIDCEGAENRIWDHKPSMRVLAQIDYIAMELHDYALTQAGQVRVIEETNQALHTLEQTHDCTREGVNFWARKR